jgi:hypothetical protein
MIEKLRDMLVTYLIIMPFVGLFMLLIFYCRWYNVALMKYYKFRGIRFIVQYDKFYNIPLRY